ncbi:hypothetical protein [Streptomyces corynorhini]|uniref:Uncharacterized protein n=1 Tax=Streptomyces corynorhini TaxID=2282652 RepID=A0A370B8K2_9ACTN|nr:hypothetical protein [Streptomyces corynorhini]RDG37951.1 hypothetical protein DVH02_11550 [Streptomyces corynorhini]
MSHLFNAAGLRQLADALEQFSAATTTTGVRIDRYSTAGVTVCGHVIDMDWRPATDDAPGEYAVRWPDDPGY